MQIGGTSWGIEETVLWENMDGGKLRVLGPEIIAVNETAHIFLNSIDEYAGPSMYYISKTGETWGDFSIITYDVSHLGVIVPEAAVTPRGDLILTWENIQYIGGDTGGIHNQSSLVLIRCILQP